MCVLTRGVGQRIHWYIAMDRGVLLPCIKHAMASLLYQLDHGIAGNASHKNAVLECAVSYARVGMELLRGQIRQDGHMLCVLSIFLKSDSVT